MKRHRRTRTFPKRIFLFSGLILCILVFVFCFWTVVSKQLRLHRDAVTYKTVTALLPASSAASSASDGEAAQENSQVALLASYQQLKKENSDFYAWLKVDGTHINYPVMYTPTQPEYYLRRDFYKNSSISGTPFIGAGCTQNGHHWVVYGHNMENGTMFSDLLRYQKETFWQEHPTLSFDTCSSLCQYEVIAAFFTQIYPETESVKFCYYNYSVLNNEDDFNTYIQNVKQLTSYSIPATATYGDDLLTLSTCSYHAENGRFVVVARKVSETTP